MTLRQADFTSERVDSPPFHPNVPGSGMIRRFDLRLAHGLRRV